VGGSGEPEEVGVTYDIVFIHRDLGQTFEAAIESALRGDPLSERLRTSWLERLEPVMRATFGNTEVDERHDEPEIRDPLSAMRLVIRGGGVVIEVPEDPSDGDAVELMQRAYGLAKEVERVTGLEGYDTVLEEPISFLPASGPPPSRIAATRSRAQPARAVESGQQVTPGAVQPGEPPRPGAMSPVGGPLWRDDEDEAAVGATATAGPADGNAGEGERPRRPWWRFWRR
jgi:hypothetical protein